MNLMCLTWRPDFWTSTDWIGADLVVVDLKRQDREGYREPAAMLHRAHHRLFHLAAEGDDEHAGGEHERGT